MVKYPHTRFMVDNGIIDHLPHFFSIFNLSRFSLQLDYLPHHVSYGGHVANNQKQSNFKIKCGK
jgi:hypothetical protein